MWERYVRLLKKEVPRSGPFVPLAVMSYLLPYEKLEIYIRRHPAILVSHFVALGCACTVASLVTALTNSGASVLISLWGICGLIFASLVFRFIKWFGMFIVVTDARLILISGFITRNAATVPLREIHDMDYTRSRLGRILGYGKYILHPSANGRRMPEMNYMPWPEPLFIEMCSIIFADSNDDG